MPLNIPNKLYTFLEDEEGLFLTPYLDSKGVLTVGIGHNLKAKPIPEITTSSTISKEHAYAILKQDVADVVKDVQRELSWVTSLDEVRLCVVLAMVFQLGIGGVLKFKNFLNALKVHNFSKASNEMLDSKWAKEDSPNRAKRAAQMMLTGRWMDE